MMAKRAAASKKHSNGNCSMTPTFKVLDDASNIKEKRIWGMITFSQTCCAELDSS